MKTILFLFLSPRVSVSHVAQKKKTPMSAPITPVMQAPFGESYERSKADYGMLTDRWTGQSLFLPVAKGTF